MTTKTANLFMRDDTILGICQAIGEDFGFNPMWLRIPLAVPVVFAPWYSIGTYAVLGVAVLASRFLFPDRKRDAVKVADVVAIRGTAIATNVHEGEPQRLAA